MPKEKLEWIRNENKKAVVIFIHGFTGHPTKTWGKFPTLLAQEQQLNGWDICCLGYATNKVPDLLRNLWSADPDISKLGGTLITEIKNRFKDHKSLALVCHSMGGLVAQYALVNNDEVRQRVTHLFLFGTPSGGLVKAVWFKLLKRQIKDMINGGDFINGLRESWKRIMGDVSSLKCFKTIAGNKDEFVPTESSLKPFDLEYHEIIHGNHLSIVKPEDAEDTGLKVVLNGLIGSPYKVPVDSDVVAVEYADFNKIIQEYGAHPADLDSRHFVNLVLALEVTGKKKEALSLLENRTQKDPEIIGVLAGRYKRLWHLKGMEKDAERATSLYKKGFKLAKAIKSNELAYYNGINVAFMYFMYREDADAAKIIATEVLGYCEKAPVDRWNEATKGEAYLYMEQFDEAIQAYTRAKKFTDSPREIDSMYTQALRIIVGTASEDNEGRIQKLDDIFKAN